MNELTEREHLVAEQYCKGLADKEVAIVLEKMKVDFDLHEIRKHGLEIFFAILFMMLAVLNYRIDMRMQMQGRALTARVIRRTSNRNEL